MVIFNMSMKLVKLTNYSTNYLLYSQFRLSAGCLSFLKLTFSLELFVNHDLIAQHRLKIIHEETLRELLFLAFAYALRSQ